MAPSEASDREYGQCRHPEPQQISALQVVRGCEHQIVDLRSSSPLGRGRAGGCRCSWRTSLITFLFSRTRAAPFACCANGTLRALDTIELWPSLRRIAPARSKSSSSMSMAYSPTAPSGSSRAPARGSVLDEIGGKDKTSASAFNSKTHGRGQGLQRARRHGHFAGAAGRPEMRRHHQAHQRNGGHARPRPEARVRLPGPGVQDEADSRNHAEGRRDAR